MLVLLIKVFLLQESGVYRQLACPMYSLTMKTIKDNCRKNIKIMKAMFVIGYMFFSTGLGDESEDALRCRILSLFG